MRKGCAARAGAAVTEERTDGAAGRFDRPPAVLGGTLVSAPGSVPITPGMGCGSMGIA